MGKKTIVKDLEGLEIQLKMDIKNSTGPIAIIGGHYPINRYGMHATRPCDSYGFGGFGIFPLYTMKLALDLVKYGKDVGKEVKLALMVDDHSQMQHPFWYSLKRGEDKLADKAREIVEPIFSEYGIPGNYQQFMKEKGITIKDFIKAKDQLPFQESLYRQKYMKEIGSDMGCSGEYRLILEEIAQKGFKKLIGLIPLRCIGPTCGVVESQYFQQREKIDMKIIQAYLSSEADEETPSMMMERTKELKGGIPIIRS